MCNRYRMTAAQAELATRYGAGPIYPPDLDLPPPELFPKRPAFIVREQDGARGLDIMRWGFPPPPAGKAPVTNVRNLSSPFWRSALKNPERRCLVPFTAFSEYGQVRGIDGKLPLHWFNVPSRPIVSFAGIWRPTEDSAKFAFLTTEPNSLVAPIHPKAMPVLLHDEDEERWLHGSIDDVIELAVPYPAQLMLVASISIDT